MSTGTNSLHPGGVTRGVENGDASDDDSAYSADTASIEPMTGSVRNVNQDMPDSMLDTVDLPAGVGVLDEVGFNERVEYVGGTDVTLGAVSVDVNGGEWSVSISREIIHTVGGCIGELSVSLSREIVRAGEGGFTQDDWIILFKGMLTRGWRNLDDLQIAVREAMGVANRMYLIEIENEEVMGQNCNPKDTIDELRDKIELLCAEKKKIEEENDRKVNDLERRVIQLEIKKREQTDEIRKLRGELRGTEEELALTEVHQTGESDESQWREAELTESLEGATSRLRDVEQELQQAMYQTQFGQPSDETSHTFRPRPPVRMAVSEGHVRRPGCHCEGCLNHFWGDKGHGGSNEE